MVTSTMVLFATSLLTSVLAGHAQREGHVIRAAVATSSTTIAAAVSTTTTAPAASTTTRAPTVTGGVSTLGASPLPLTKYSFAYDQIPYQVNPFPVERGPQSGYNICNSSTAGPDSQCQTAILSSIKDWCLWGSPTTDANGTIGDVEAAVVAYCVKDTHGTRVIPGGAVTALQFMRTSNYIQITGLIDQTVLNLQASDTGGELDPHGADLMGNPLGGLVYSAGLPNAKDNTTLIQANEWNNFIGGGIFCFKLCDPSQPTPNYCENRYDLIGCSYNMPASYTPNEFTSCEGELQDIAGHYVDANGVSTTWSQPDPGPVTTALPYTPRIPASSNCITYQSTDLFTAVLATTTSSSVTSTSSSKNPTSTSSGRPSSTSTTTSTSSSPTATKIGAANVLSSSVAALGLGALAAGLLA